MVIAADGDESWSNVTSFGIQGITHFDNNIENVLNTFMQLNERIIKPKNMTDKNQEFKRILKFLHLLCSSGPATQTLQEAMKVARTEVVEQYLLLNHTMANGLGNTLKEDETLFYNSIEQDFTDLDPEVYPDTETYKDAYRAFKQQVEYMLHQIVKPFGASVELSFRRDEVMAALMEFFPPTCSRGKQPTMAQWAKFNEVKSLSKEQRQEIKYKLLPPFFHDKFENLERNWDEMDDVQFLVEAQKIEKVDIRERIKSTEKKDKDKSKRKREKGKDDDDSVSSLSRSQASSNWSNKRRKGGKTTSQGHARECELCKLSGAPEFVFKTHYTNQCKKKDQYAKALSGGAGQREKTKREYKSMEKKLRKELKMVQKKLARKKQVNPTDSDDESMESSE